MDNNKYFSTFRAVYSDKIKAGAKRKTAKTAAHKAARAECPTYASDIENFSLNDRQTFWGVIGHIVKNEEYKLARNGIQPELTSEIIKEPKKQKRVKNIEKADELNLKEAVISLAKIGFIPGSPYMECIFGDAAHNLKNYYIKTYIDPYYDVTKNDYGYVVTPKKKTAEEVEAEKIAAALNDNKELLAALMKLIK